MTKLPTHDAIDWIAPAEASQILGVSNKTLANLANDGKIRANKLPSGHRRYDRASVEALAKGGDAR